MESNAPTPPARTRPLLIYDGDCGFCLSWVVRWHAATGDAVEYRPAQEVADEFPAISRTQFARSVVYVEPEGHSSFGAEAVFRTLAHAPNQGWMLWLYRHLWPVRTVSEPAYAFVARHRGLFTRLTGIGHRFRGRGERPRYHQTRNVLIRSIGLIYVLALASLWPQLDGLIGEQGIAPAGAFLQSLRQYFGGVALGQAPTIFWWTGASNAVLHTVCAAGIVAGLSMMAGVLPLASAIVAWGAYLSISTVGNVFLSYQWDALLLEAGALVILMSPASAILSRARHGPPWIAIWLVRWLLLRVVFMSGLVKLASGDPAWRTLRAMDYHYFTQPLPNPVSWYAQQLPHWAQAASVAGTFAIELGLPILLLGPRRLRVGAAIGIAVLMVSIGATGNYGFFQLLVLALCVAALDDSLLPAFLRRAPLAAIPAGAGVSARVGTLPAVAFACIVLSISSLQLQNAIDGQRNRGGLRAALERTAAPLHLVNRYGLFAVMTTERPEIIVEASADGEAWLPYKFPYKAGVLDRLPAQVAPHHPRLDWQMWFAALDDCRKLKWFHAFLWKLRQAEPDVLSLLDHPPFGMAKPMYVRAKIYRYEFTDRQHYRETGNRWRRTGGQLFCPVMGADGWLRTDFGHGDEF